MELNEILVAFAGEKTRQYMAGVFRSTDVKVSAVRGTGAEILNDCRKWHGSVVLCGVRLYDMTAQELYEALPKGVDMVLLADEAELCQITDPGICKVAAPAHQNDLISAVREQFAAQAARHVPAPQRSDADKAIILEAKGRLMEQKTLSEEQAYRLIQKKSMDMGWKMVETARAILSGQLNI